jgi:hypothetical protein
MKIQLIEKVITAGGFDYSISDELDRQYKYLTGIAVLDVIGERSLFVSSSIEGKELFPKNFEVGFIQSSKAVSPDRRFFSLSGKRAEGAKIELLFKDGESAPAYPYTLRIYLRLENEELQD